MKIWHCQKGISNYVKFAGNCKQEFIANILPHSAAIISPHMGRGLTEAALSGVPIVGYDYDWQREVIISDKTGYLIEHEKLDGNGRCGRTSTKQ